MTTLLQTLLLRTLPLGIDFVLRAYIEKLLPVLEQEVGMISVAGGSNRADDYLSIQKENRWAKETTKCYVNPSEQPHLLHILNSLLIAWNLLPFLNSAFTLSDNEKRILCLGLTLHSQSLEPGRAKNLTFPLDIAEDLALCRAAGERLNFDAFWSEWREYMAEIAYLAQIAQCNPETIPLPSQCPDFKISDPIRLELLEHLLAFGRGAAQLTDPADLVTQTKGSLLQEHLRFLGIRRKLIYHRSRD